MDALAQGRDDRLLSIAFLPYLLQPRHIVFRYQDDPSERIEIGPSEARGEGALVSQPDHSRCPLPIGQRSPAHHVEDRDDRESRRILLALTLLSRRDFAHWPCASEASAERVDADNEEFIRIERLTRSNELFPPAWCRIGFRRRGMGRGRESGVEEDGVCSG